jgi:hypothetical protein
MFRDWTINVVGIVAFNACAMAASAQSFALADESNQFNEARRRDQISRQLDLNYRMIYLSGFGPRFPNPFEPWPRVPGDIWGYPQGRPIVHPVGHESAQLSDTRWIYRPVYAVPSLAVPIATEPAPRLPAVSPRLPGPADAVAPPRPAPARTREF